MKRLANSLVHGGMSFVMLVNQMPAVMAQQGVNVLNTNQNGATTSANSSPVVIANDQSTVPTQLKAGTAVVGTATVGVQQGNSSTTITALHVCGNYTSLSMSVATTLQVIAASSGKTIYICDFDISNGVTSTTTITWQIGTGTNCASGLAQLGSAWYAGTNWAKIAANSAYRGLNSGAVGSSALCVKSTVTTTFDVGVYYDQF